MLKIIDVNVDRGGNCILQPSNHCFDFSKRYLFYGKMGAGKTTFFELVTGIEKPAVGDVLIDDISIYDSDFMDLSLSRKKLGVMFDLPGLISNQNVFENIRLAIDSKKIQFTKPLDEILIQKYLSVFNMEHVLYVRPGLLSIEQRRVVAFIRAIITNPKFLVLDGFSDFLNGPYSSAKIDFLDDLKRKSVGGLFFSKEKILDNMFFDHCFEIRDGDFYEF